MREIRFRGRSVVNDRYNGIKVGDWVYGCFIQSGCDAPCIIFGDGEQVEIDRDTLSQYTGLKDSEGAEIYERDIVRCIPDGEYELSYVCKVERKGTALTVEVRGFEYDYTCIHWAADSCYLEYKVIGNVHENPELLENNND